MQRNERNVHGEVSGKVGEGEGEAGERSLWRSEPPAYAPHDEPDAARDSWFRIEAMEG
jgi:hypothetical protein